MPRQKRKTTVQAKQPTPPAEENSVDETASGSLIEPDCMATIEPLILSPRG